MLTGPSGAWVLFALQRWLAGSLVKKRDLVERGQALGQAIARIK